MDLLGFHPLPRALAGQRALDRLGGRVAATKPLPFLGSGGSHLNDDAPGQHKLIDSSPGPGLSELPTRCSVPATSLFPDIVLSSLRKLLPTGHGPPLVFDNSNLWRNKTSKGGHLGQSEAPSGGQTAEWLQVSPNPIQSLDSIEFKGPASLERLRNPRFYICLW